jgi:integrase
MRFLSAPEVEALASEITDRYRILVPVACYGGPRWSELVGLRRRDVEGDRVTVAGQLVRRADGNWHRDEPKTRAGRRTITLPASVAADLADHLERFALNGDDGLVLPNREGSPLVSSSWNGNVFRPACVRARLARLVDAEGREETDRRRATGDLRIVDAPRPHDMRHTAVALAGAAGAHPTAIQRRMGHASITVTLDRYGHLFPELDEQVADRLDALRSH